MIQIASPLARQVHEPGSVVFPAGSTPARWLVGDAFERLGKADSAAHYYRLGVEDPHRPPEDGPYRAVIFSLPTGGWRCSTSPDPALVTLATDVRAALPSADAMESPLAR